jgi:uncharacterized protein
MTALRRCLARVALVLAAAAGLCAPLTARADTPHPAIWAVQGRHNTVYLFGSVHVRQTADAELPPSALAAYSRARALVLETDLDAAMASMSSDRVMAITMLPPGPNLAEVLGPDLNARYVKRARELGIDPDFTQRYQPWFAAISLVQVELAQAGFDPAAGIDLQLANRARNEHKPVIGLESLEDEFHVFGDMSLDDQRGMLAQALESPDEERGRLDKLLQAWRAGDLAGLQAASAEEARDQPDVWIHLTIDRNRKWLPRLQELLASDDDYLVVVGALHLVGEGSVVDLLQKSGYKVTRQ